MAIVQTILSLLIRRAGRVLNTLFGWATTLLFGKVPEKRQIYLSVVALGSVLWIAVTLGIIFPSVGTFLLAFVTLPDWVKPHWIRLAMLAAAIVIPPIVGGVSLLLVDPEERPHGAKNIAKQVLRGYPYTIGLAVTLLIMLIVAPIMKIQNIFRRWKSNHIPVVVEPEDYLQVVRDVQRVLWSAGIQTEQHPASPLLRWPTEVFTWFVRGGIEDLVAAELKTLRGSDLDVIVHPSDLLLRGREERLTRAYATITESLTFTKCYMTWTKEAREFEDRYESVLQELSQHEHLTTAAMDQLRELDEDLKEIKVTNEEWDVLLRVKLQAERIVLRRIAGLEITDRQHVLAERESALALGVDEPPRSPSKKQGERRSSPALINTMAAVLGLIAWIRRGRKEST